jgi:hydrogenase expression/formation protein HypD
MKFVDEYRDAQTIQKYVDLLGQIVTRPRTIMEICGGQTHAIVKYGLDRLLADKISLIHGPGCPVCVTPAATIDMAIAIAAQPNVILCSFGDMLRVPGSAIVPADDFLPKLPKDLLSVKATGADIRIVYSPLDALKLAQKHPEREIVFFAVGFETTAPATAIAIYQAQQQGLKNFSLLVSHVLVPPAMETILAAPNCQIEGFLAAGHVCTVMGYEEYEPIAERYRVPIVITGFEPLDILQGIYLCIQQLERGTYQVINQYKRSVRDRGNTIAQNLIQEIFQIVPQQWRGIGQIPQSGLAIKEKYRDFDALKKFQHEPYSNQIASPSPCMSGLILQGILKPQQCPAFGTQCTPENPLGAPMVSSEGACAAYYRYRI